MTRQTATRSEILNQVNDDLQLISAADIPGVDEPLEHWALFDGIIRYCTARGWSILFEYSPSTEEDEPYVVRCILEKPLPQIDSSEEPKILSAESDGHASATTAALSLISSTCTNFWEDKDELS